MALRCASVGACENAGIASPNVIVVSDAKTVALRLNVLIIWRNPYGCRGRNRRLKSKWATKTLEINFASHIIFAFEFHCKRIVAMHAWRAFLRKNPSRSRNERGTGMKPRPPPACVEPDEREMNCAAKRSAATVSRIGFVIFSLAALSACEQNSFVPPPPPKVDVAVPVQRAVTRFLEATGNTAPVKSVDLVARVQGVLQSIDYKDGEYVKAGTTLFTIEPDTYKYKLQQAQAAEAGAQASLKQAEADFKRQADLVARQAVSQATLDTSTATRDNAQANLLQAQANTRIAAVNYGYTNVVAPFDGFVSAHLVSVGELVGVASPTQLATIVQHDPIFVNFTVNEQQVLRIRAEAARKGLTSSDLRQTPVEVGLQTESGFPHRGNLDYAAPTINQSTGTLAVRGLLPNADRILLPGYFVRVRVPLDEQQGALLVPSVALGSDQAGRYVLVVNKYNVVEQRKVETGQVEGELRVIDSGLKPDDRIVIAGLLRAIPGQKVDPQLQKIEQPPAPTK
jgi:RND family efflux transporter MFP subunit